MPRRTALQVLIAFVASLFGNRRAYAGGAAATDWKQKEAEAAARLRTEFPYEMIETNGSDAYTKWETLKGAGRGIPVIVGGDDGFVNLLEPFGSDIPIKWRSPPVDVVLQRAASIKFPEDLAAKHKVENDAALASLKASLAKDPNTPLPTIIESGKDGQRTLSRKETEESLLADPVEPAVGAWPTASQGDPGLTVTTNILTQKPLDKVYIVLVPTDDWTTIPAYLRWGGWNENPPAEYHVAALRRWRDLYGAELIGLSFDTMNLRVTRRPKDRDEALALAKEQYIYCADIIDQGTETYSNLAATLMNSDWWFFWWD